MSEGCLRGQGLTVRSPRWWVGRWGRGAIQGAGPASLPCTGGSCYLGCEPECQGLHAT